jgi:hypothetical protein
VKSDATWHPRRTAPWVCEHCARRFPVDSLCADHETKCPMRPEETA